jgi:hypothetical protein
MSRLHSRSVAEITIRTEGRVYRFKAGDWSLNLEQPRFDVTQMGSPIVWCPGPTRGSLDFYIVPDGSPVDLSADDQVDMRLEQLKRYMDLLGVPDDV